MNGSWANAYVEQGASDWRMYERLLNENWREPPVESCHVLHYLQMSTEKLGKGFLLAAGARLRDVNTSHEAFVQYLETMTRNHGLCELLDMTPSRLERHIGDLIPLARDIERLAPQLSGSSPNPEYPWRDEVSSEVYTPARYVFELLEEMMERGQRLANLIDTVVENRRQLIQ